MSNIPKAVTRYHDGINGLNGSRIWNNPCAIDWHHNIWPWMTLNSPSSRSSKLHVKYFKNCDRYDDGVNRIWIWNHSWAIDWHHDLWSWMTLNRPGSRPQNFRIKYLEYRERYNVRHNSHQWLPTGTMNFDLGWPWTGVVRGYQNYVKYF